MAISENIRVLREKNGMSQNQLAEKLQISQVLVHKYESGICQPNATMAVSIAKTFGTTVEKLVEGDSEVK